MRHQCQGVSQDRDRTSDHELLVDHTPGAWQLFSSFDSVRVDATADPLLRHHDSLVPQDPAIYPGTT